MQGNLAGRPQQERHEVLDVISKASYFSVFTVPDPQSLSEGVPLIPAVPQSVYEIAITEAPRRFSSCVGQPTAECGFQTGRVVGRRQIAKQSLRLQVAPNNFESGPGRTPPPTVLIPFLSQRFWMFNGEFDFLDGLGTGFRAIAGGRFFPVPQAFGSVFVAGVAEILEGLGQLDGVVGNLAINGVTTPPARFANQFTFRFVDPQGRLSADRLPPVEPEAGDPDYTQSSFITLLAEVHPDLEVETSLIANSAKQRVRFVEQLRAVDTNFDVGPRLLKSHIAIGGVVGQRNTTFVFDPQDPNDTIPVYTENSEFRFFAGGTPIGRLKADLFEARAFRTWSPDLQHPYFRVAGFGPLKEGTGQFAGVRGLMTLNGAISLSPLTVSSMYTIRILDPRGRFRSAETTC